MRGQARVIPAVGMVTLRLAATHTMHIVIPNMGEGVKTTSLSAIIVYLGTDIRLLRIYLRNRHTSTHVPRKRQVSLMGAVYFAVTDFF